MKKVIIGIFIIFLLISSTYSDIMIPGQGCIKYDESCYSNCMVKQEGLIYSIEDLCIQDCCFIGTDYAHNKNIINKIILITLFISIVGIIIYKQNIKNKSKKNDK